MRAEIAIIGGSGIYSLGFVESVSPRTVSTPYGESSGISVGEFADRKVAFMARHGAGHTLPPHLVNYRANIWALHTFGVKRIIATAATGSLNPNFEPGQFVLPDQFLDFTKGRPSTFYEGGEGGVVHVDVTDPYCPELREVLAKAGKRVGLKLHIGGTYVCTEGPRFETAAEIKMMRRLGGDLVGMTGVPECVLARELEICYSAVCVVTNFAAGISRKKLTHAEVVDLMGKKAEELGKLISAAIPEIPRERNCPCSRALRGARAEPSYS